jgi:hypothetical protein
MLKMLTLIKREIYDNIAYFVGAFVLSMILIICIVSAAYHSDDESAPIFAIALSIPVIVILIIGFTSMGVSQMYIDRNRKISTFLLTLPVTRGRILTARLIAGILAILTLFLPIIITTIILYQLFIPSVPFVKSMFFDVCTTLTLVALAYYSIGLQTGWMTGKVLPPLAGFVLTFIFASIIIIKGFGPEIQLLLIIFVVASVIRIWRKFMDTSL